MKAEQNTHFELWVLAYKAFLELEEQVSDYSSSGYTRFDDGHAPGNDGQVRPNR